MSYKNPTYLQIGRMGNYGGRTWHVEGRAVLGETEEGEIYYWNEFNLETGSGEKATLVFERTERGSEWRWFTEFEPEYAMTAADAATKEVGDLLNLDGTDVTVTLVQTSRIYFVEGKPPAGEAVGCVASYFNAENGNEMLVVSWTGAEVEYFRGRTISNEQVRAAFHLDRTEHITIPAGAVTRYNRVEPSGLATWDLFPKLVAGFLLLWVSLVLVKALLVSPAGSTVSGITRLAAPPAPLQLGATGRLAGVNYRVTGHVLQELVEVDLQGGQQVYYLHDDENNEARLVSGFIPGNKDWILFAPLHPLAPMTPFGAAAVKLGQIVNLDGMVAPVDQLFATTIKESEFADTPELVTGEKFFGFAGQRDTQYLLATWNIGTITFWRGHSLSAQTVLAALGPGAPAK